jgi:hypothetical protein
MALSSEVHKLQQGPANPDGKVYGSSATDPIGFYGVTTPVAQRATGSNTLMTTGATTTVQTAVLIEIQATLVALGLMPAT